MMDSFAPIAAVVVLGVIGLAACGDDSGATPNGTGASGTGASGTGAAGTTGSGNAGTGAGSCTPNCSGKVCGDDLCGGSCGRCATTEVCTTSGQCLEPTESDLGFFVTSTGNGASAGNFGGVAGADAFCGGLAERAGVIGKTWRAYVSTASEDARDRIGSGPWENAAGDVVAESVAALHANGIPAAMVVDENGQTIDLANAHDILTGSRADGTFSGQNCQDYASSSPDVFVTVGHADGGGVGDEDPASWNSAHDTNGCDQQTMQNTACQSHLYCFAQ